MTLFRGETLGSSDPTLLRAEFSQGHCVWILGFIGWCRHELHPCSKLSVNRPGKDGPKEVFFGDVVPVNHTPALACCEFNKDSDEVK